MSGTIIQFFMILRNATKIYHWNTKSYPRHKATDEFVENMDKLIDRFVEVYVGRYGRDKALSHDMDIKLPGFTEKSIIKFFEEARTWLSTTLPPMLKSHDTDLLNIRDEMLAELNQALYLFTLN
jgi:hypothetical protein